MHPHVLPTDSSGARRRPVWALVLGALAALLVLGLLGLFVLPRPGQTRPTAGATVPVTYPAPTGSYPTQPLPTSAAPSASGTTTAVARPVTETKPPASFGDYRIATQSDRDGGIVWRATYTGPDPARSAVVAAQRDESVEHAIAGLDGVVGESGRACGATTGGSRCALQARGGAVVVTFAGLTPAESLPLTKALAAAL